MRDPCLISKLDEGNCSASDSHDFTTGERALGTSYRTVCVPQPVWTSRRRDKFLAPAENCVWFSCSCASWTFFPFFSYILKYQTSFILISLSHIIFPLLPKFIHQWLYSPLLYPDLFFSSAILFTQTVGLLGGVISPSQGRYLHTGQCKQVINAHRHPCIEWDSNPRSQRPSERRRFMP
jgi:hypothetical protein